MIKPDPNMLSHQMDQDADDEPVSINSPTYNQSFLSNNLLYIGPKQTRRVPDGQDARQDQIPKHR